MTVLHLLWANLKLRWAEWWQPSAPDLCDRIRRVWQADREGQ